MRRGTRSRLFLASAAVGSVLAWGALARADARTEARSHFRKGMGLISHSQYEEAIRELQRAYEILPHPSLLYNIGRAYLEIGDIEAATANFRKYLESDPADREETLQLIDSIEARLKTQQAAAAAAMVGQAPAPASPTPGPLPAEPSADGQVTRRIAAPTPPAARELLDDTARTDDVFEESVISASRAAQSPLEAPNSTSLITEQDIRLSGITKVPELLRRLAGVDIMQATGAQTEVSLRGFNQRLSNKTLVLVNGRTIYVDLLGATIWSFLSVGVEDIERIEIVRGPGSALYGADAFNGVVNIITKAPGEGPSGASVAYGDRHTTHGSVWATGREKSLAWRFSGGYDYLPRWSREVSPTRVDADVAPGDADASHRTVRLDLRGTQRLARKMSLTLGGSLVKGDTEFLGIGPVADVVVRDITVTDVTAYLDADHLQFRTFWNHFSSPDQRNNVAYVGQSPLPGRPNIDIADAELQYVNRFQTGASIAHDLHIGASYRFKSVVWGFLDRHRDEHHQAAFVHDEVKLGPRFAFIGDLRADYVPFLQRVIPSPRGSLLFHPSDRSTVRAVLATAFRKPTFLESYLSLSIPLPVSGVSSIAGTYAGREEAQRVREERVVTAELGYMNQDSDLFTFDSALFYNRVDGLIQLEPNRPITLADVARGAGPLDAASNRYPAFFTGFNNACQGFDVLGGEAGVRFFPAEGLDIYGNYTINVTHQDDSRCNAAELALLQRDERTSLHKVNVGIQVRTRAGIDGSIDFHHVSPQRWAEQVVSEARQRLEYLAFPLPAYSLVNARLGYRFLSDHADASITTFNAIGTPHRQHPFGQVVDRRVMAMFTYRL